MSTPVGDMLVVGRDSAFQLKLIPLNPREYTGAGTELPESNDVTDSGSSVPAPEIDRKINEMVEKLRSECGVVRGGLTPSQSFGEALTVRP